MMYLLDTDTLTHLHAGNTNLINRLETLQDEEIAITIVTKIEILRGRIDYLLKAFSGSDLLKAQELFCRSETLLNKLPVISIDKNAANQFELLQSVSKFRKIRFPIKLKYICPSADIYVGKNCGEKVP